MQTPLPSAAAACPTPALRIQPTPSSTLKHHGCLNVSSLHGLLKKTLAKVLESRSISVKVGQGQAHTGLLLRSTDGGGWQDVESRRWWRGLRGTSMWFTPSETGNVNSSLPGASGLSGHFYVPLPQFRILDILASTDDWHLSKTCTALCNGLFNTKCYLVGTCFCWV